MCSKEDQGSAFDQCFRNSQCNCKTVSTTCTTTELVDDDKTVFVNVSSAKSISEVLRMTRVETHLRMKAVSLISAAKVDTLASILSSIETRAKI